MKILTVSDHESPMVYSPQIAERFSDVDLLISCGDLSPHYLDYMVSMLNRPFYYVHGNHVFKEVNEIVTPQGGQNLHHRTLRDPETGLILAGMEGSVCYNQGDKQYTQGQMWRRILSLSLSLQRNRLLYGRPLDIFVAHAPPWAIHDEDDLAHHGFIAYRWLIRVFQPRLFVHGHIHIYRQDKPYSTQVGRTLVLNTFPYRVTEIEV